MSLWTIDELALAIKLTSVQGRSFQETSEILIRHGYSARSGDSIKDKIRVDAPKSWAFIEQARKTRKSSEICGVAAPAPKGRMSRISESLVNLIKTLEPNLTEADVCWVARQVSFDCNITDIRVAAQRAEYIFSDAVQKGISYFDAIAKDLCLWPLDNGEACGGCREVDRYCGPHHCRSLGDVSLHR